MKGLFGDMFDFDRNGELDSFERAMEYQFFEEMVNDEEPTELQAAGIDPEELEYMDSWERRQLLEDAGLDPDEYDF